MEGKSNGGPTVLVVEDDAAMLVALRDILEGSGYCVYTAIHGQDALGVLAKQRPSLILSDIAMPVMDGIELFRAVRKSPGGKTIPFVFLTAKGSREDLFQGKSLGVDDYITKPVTSKEVLAAVHARLQRTDEIMVAQLQTAYKASLTALANAIEARDRYTRDHVERVNAYAQAMAIQIGWDERRRDVLEYSAILHDIGKIAVREAILTKTGPLSPSEWQEMKEHPRVGGRMVEGITYLSPAMAGVVHHHERWDGTGYPTGLRENAIPEEARLLAVVDTFDAMTSDRPYHPAFPALAAHQEIVSQVARQFDPAMVQAFCACWDRGEIHQILERPR
jgi:putative two-component system response regulator